MLLQDKEILDEHLFSADQTFFLENGESDNAFLILKGAVALCYQDINDNREIVVRIVGKGELVGALDWINFGTHLFTARAVEETKCLLVTNENLVKNYLKSPPSIQSVLRSALNKLRGIKHMNSFVTVADAEAAVKKVLSDDSDNIIAE